MYLKKVDSATSLWAKYRLQVPGTQLMEILAKYYLIPGMISVLRTAFDKSNLRVHGEWCHQKLIKRTIENSTIM